MLGINTKRIRISKMKCLRMRVTLTATVFSTESKVIKQKQNYVIYCERSSLTVDFIFYCFEEEEEKKKGDRKMLN